MKNRIPFALITILALLLTGCSRETPVPVTPAVSTDLPAATIPAPTATPPIEAQPTVEAPTLVPTNSIESLPYVPVDLEVCQMLQEMAAQAIAAEFTLEASVPFSDPLTGQTGQGCRFTATGTEKEFENPQSVITRLVSGFVGFTELPEYQADGPTGSATAMSRDMGLLLISADWEPAPGTVCPEDQPIGMCELKPEEKLYTVTVQAAMK